MIMPTFKTEAVVLRARDFAETDVILTLFTRDRGKMDALVKAGRKSSSRLGGGCQFLNTIQLEYFAREHTQLCRLIRVDLAVNRDPVRMDMVKYAWASLLMEVVMKSSAEHEAHPELYDQINLYLDQLHSIESVRVFSLAHLIRVLAITGFEPLMTECIRCRRPRPLHRTLEQSVFSFDQQQGGLICTPCRKGLAPDEPVTDMTPQMVMFLQAALRDDPEVFRDLKLASNDAQILMDIMVNHAGRQLETDLKSVSFIHAVETV